MQPFREFTITYPASWKLAYNKGTLVPRWQTDRPKAFARVHSGITGGGGLFAQAALARLLSEKGYWFTSWYKLAFDPVKVRGREEAGEIAVRQAIVAAHIGTEQFKDLRQALLKQGLTIFKGEPDLFCWHPHKPQLWFFAEAKDEDTGDELAEHQIEWMNVAKEVLGQPDLRVYSMKPERRTKTT